MNVLDRVHVVLVRLLDLPLARAYARSMALARRKATEYYARAVRAETANERLRLTVAQLERELGELVCASAGTDEDTRIRRWRDVVPPRVLAGLDTAESLHVPEGPFAVDGPTYGAPSVVDEVSAAPTTPEEWSQSAARLRRERRTLTDNYQDE